MGPAGLAARQVFLGEEVAEVVMVGLDGEVFAAFEVVAVDLDGVNDGEEFLLVNK